MITAEQIKAFVEENRDEAIQCLREIIQTPSVTGNEGPVSKVFSKWIEDCGMTVERYGCEPDRDCLISEWFGSEKGKRFIFNGHMDVFPPPAIASEDFAPWGADIREGYMYGRGTSDMKGGDCAALMAVRLLRRMGFDPKGSVVLSYMVDEENGGGKGVKYLIRQGLLKGDFGLCMEPTHGTILNRHWGILRMTFSYTAVPYHSGQPHPSIDALGKAITAINRLYALNAQLNQDKTPNGVPCLTVTMFNGGNTPNVTAAYAEFVVDRRIAMHEDPAEAKAQILAIFDELKAENPEFDYKYEITSDRPPMDIPDDDPFIQLVARSYEQIMGKPAEYGCVAGGSDAASLRAAYGYPIPLMGAAETFGDHGCGGKLERINLQDYLDSIKYYMMTVVNALS